MQNNSDLLNLKKVLETELSTLKNTHRSISKKIKAFETKTASDIGFEIGDEVKLSESGDSATITGINSSRNTVTVVTGNGQTMEVPSTKLSSIEADMATAAEDNAEVTEVTESVVNEEDDKKKQ